MGSRVRLITVVAGAPALGACGGAAQGTAPVVRVADEVRAANEAGAHEDPRAAGSLDLAEGELSRARVELGAGDVAGARAWAERARADAGLSRMLAIEAATRGAAQRSEDDALALSRALDDGGHAPKPPREPPRKRAP